MTILATMVVLGVLIFVHELGHFMAAKSVGIEVQRFSIGLGPKLFGFRRGETEYVLSVIPLGGYVKMGGMDDEVMEKVEGGAEPQPRMPSPRDFDQKSLAARAFVISAGVIMNILFAFLLFTSVVAIWGVPELRGTRIGQVVGGALPAGTEALAQLPIGATIVRIGGQPVDSWGQVTSVLAEAPAGATEVVTQSPAVTVSVDLPADQDSRIRVVTAINAWLEPKVGAVNPGSPAERANMRTDDRILSVNGTKVASWYDFVEQVQSQPGNQIDLSVERGGDRLELQVTPEPETSVDPVTGESRTVGKIGVYPPFDDVAYRKVGIISALGYGARQTSGTATLILDFLGKLASREVPASSVGSIVTIGEASGQAARAGVDQFLQFMALFSVNLAVLNVLPIPVLDGGHLLFLAIEGIRGRALSIEQRLRWSNVGLWILIAIMLFAFYNDMMRVIRRLIPGMF